MRMFRPHHSIALRYRVAIAVTLILAALLAAQPARADGAAPLSRLVKFENRDYEITYGAGVSLDASSSATVNKVGYGHVRAVNIATMPTGTYSSDAMFSPNVLYPGVSVRRIIEEPENVLFPSLVSSSFSIRSIGRSPSGALVVNRIDDLGVRSCVVSGSITTCYRTY